MNKKNILSLIILSVIFSSTTLFAAEVVPVGNGAEVTVLEGVDFTPVSCEEVGLTSNLKLGNRNDQVVILQEILNYAGYDVGGIDGWFGFKTRSAVKEMQNVIGVKSDGIVGPVTRSAMLEICTSYTSSS